MQKYNLSELTQEEQEQFAKDFQSFLDEKSIYFEPVPVFQRKDLESPFEIKCSVVVQKKTAIEEAPAPEIIPSPDEVAPVPSPQDEEVNPNA